MTASFFAAILLDRSQLQGAGGAFPLSSTTSLTRQFDTVVTPAPTKVRWRIFVLMLMLIAINYIDRASISVAMPVISNQFDLDLRTQGFILSSFFLTYAPRRSRAAFLPIASSRASSSRRLPLDGASSRPSQPFPRMRGSWL